MPYTPQTWADDPAGNTPITAARLAYIENGVRDATALGEEAMVYVDEHTGAETDPAPMPGQYVTPNTYVGPLGVRSTLAMVTNSEYAVPLFLSQAATVTTLGVEITAAGVAGTVIRLGIRADNGTGRPDQLIVDAGTVVGTAISTGIEKTGLSVNLSPGLYWFCAAAQGGAPTVRSSASDLWPVAANTLVNALGTSPCVGYVATPVAGALPATFTVVDRASAVPRVVAKVT
jgi:hypothetical protein